MAESASEPKMAPDDLQAVVERLRASKGDVARQRQDYGLLLGSAWSHRSASYHQLRRLRDVLKTCSSATLETLLVREPDAQFFALVGPERFGDHQVPADFWASVLRIEDRVLKLDADFVRGFAVGANELFGRIERCL